MPDDDTPQPGLRSLLTETRFGSTTPLGCIVQMLLTGIITVLVCWLVLALA